MGIGIGVVFGHYPMTPAQLAQWAREQDDLSPKQCARAIARLEPPAHRITIRRA